MKFFLYTRQKLKTRRIIHKYSLFKRGLSLLCDDTEREYGSMKAADKMKAACEANGWVSVSMRDDFRTIYGDDVKRADKGDNIQK